MANFQKTTTTSNEHAKAFHQNGYQVFPGVYSQAEVQTARDAFVDLFKDDSLQQLTFNSPNIVNDIYRHNASLAKLVFNQPYFDALYQLLGDEIVWLPECAVHRNRYIDWHKDTTEQELAGVLSHQAGEPMLQVATYFQDNGEAGGGLDRHSGHT